MNRREALRTLAAGSAAGALAGGMVIMTTPSATAAPIGAGLAFAIERHRAALSDLLASARLYDTCEEAARKLPTPETLATMQATDEAAQLDGDREANARSRLFAEPVATMAEVQAKAQYLAENARHFAFDDDMAALMASIVGQVTTVGTASPALPDPAHDALTRYHQQVADFNHPTKGISDEDLNALRDDTWGPFWEAVEADPSVMPPATSLAGALLALRTMLMEENLDGFAEGCLRSALAYFDGRA